MLDFVDGRLSQEEVNILLDDLSQNPLGIKELRGYKMLKDKLQRGTTLRSYLSATKFNTLEEINQIKKK